MGPWPREAELHGAGGCGPSTPGLGPEGSPPGWVNASVELGALRVSALLFSKHFL